MRPTNFFAAAALALAVTACGASPLTSSSDNDDSAAAAPAASGAAATLGSTALGDVLVGEGGLTLYGFTNDTQAVSTCSGTCADAWPPVIVGPDWTVAPGLDSGIFATTTRDDGQLQLVAGKWPLYYFAGDVAAGDLNGQGSGDVWFVVAPDGSLITDAPAAGGEAAAGPTIGVGSSPEGQILVDGSGLSLYGFTDDAAGTPTCVEACADAWPPLIVSSPDLPAGLDPAVFSVVQRPDGSLQLKAGKWPLYYFAGDAAAGDVNGQGSGGVWFLAAPDGSLVGAAAAGGEGEQSADEPASSGGADGGSADGGKDDDRDY